MGKINYIKNPKNGQMEGSYPSPAFPPPPPNIPVRTLSNMDDPLPEFMNVDYAVMRTIIAERNTTPPWQIIKPETGEVELHKGKLIDELMHSNNPAIIEMNSHVVNLDSLQTRNIMFSALGSEVYAMEKANEPLFERIPQSNWDEWNREQAARVRKEKGEDSDLAERYDALIGTPPPTNVEFALMKRAPIQGMLAVKSLEREVRYIAGHHDLSVEDAEAAFKKARQAYLNLPEEDRPETPEWFVKAIKSSAFGKGWARMKKPPLDAATAYALYTCVTNPEATAGYPKTGKGYVVFDTETAGVNHTDNILQVTAIQYDSNGVEVRKISTYINPGEDENGVINTGNDQAVAIHGITADTVKDAPAFKEVAGDLYDMMEGRTIVGHNIMFDYPKVQRALDLAGHPVLTSGAMVDTLRFARYVSPTPPGETAKTHSHRLQACCERAGIPFSEEAAHDAAYDVDRTNALFRFLRTASFGNLPK